MDNRYVSGCSSGVERLLPKQDVVGSNPITRSSYQFYPPDPGIMKGADLESKMTVVSLDLESPDDLKMLDAQWKFGSGWIPGEPNEGLVSQASGSPARLAEYDDSDWEILSDIEPGFAGSTEGGLTDPGLRKGRSVGLTFGWYRIRVTFPEHVRGMSLLGTQVWFETNIDDYGEIWVDGQLDSPTGVIHGLNVTSRVLVTDNAHPDAVHVIACLAINGPLGQPEEGIFLRYGRLDFEKIL